MTKQEDIFDVVNENDEVTGQEPRSVVHRENLLHRAVHLWLKNSDGRVLLQRRAKVKANHPDVYDSSASGHVDTGEAYDFSMMREAHEEIGVNLGLTDLEEIAYVKACDETEQEFVRLYIAENEGPFTLQETEVDDVKWFSPEEIDKMLDADPSEFAPAFRYLWGLYGSLGK